MKKVIFSALVLGLAFGLWQDSWAAGRTAVSLATTAGMIGDIDTPSSGVPMGTVITWPYATLPASGDYLECNGQTVSAAQYPEFVKAFGNTVPDYRGLFLRARGGNAGALNALQAESVNVPQSAGVKMHFDGIAKGSYYITTYTQHDTSGDGGVWNNADTGLEINTLIPQFTEIERPVVYWVWKQ